MPSTLTSSTPTAAEGPGPTVGRQKPWLSRAGSSAPSSARFCCQPVAVRSLSRWDFRDLEAGLNVGHAGPGSG